MKENIRFDSVDIEMLLVSLSFSEEKLRTVYGIFKQDEGFIRNLSTDIHMYKIRVLCKSMQVKK